MFLSENLACIRTGFRKEFEIVSIYRGMIFTSFDLRVANMGNLFAPVFTKGKNYTQGGKVLSQRAIQVHQAV